MGNEGQSGRCWVLRKETPKLSLKKKYICKKKSETKMTASVLKQDPNAQNGSNERLFIMTQTQSKNCRGNPLCQHLNS